MDEIPDERLRGIAQSMNSNELKELFDLEKRVGKEFKHVGIRVFIEFLSKNGIFHRSFAEELEKLYIKIFNLQEKRKSLKPLGITKVDEEELGEMEADIEKTKGDILESISQGSIIIKRMIDHISHFIFYDKSVWKELEKKKFKGFKVGATDIQGGLHIIKGLFEKLDANYSEMRKDLKALINAPVPNTEIDFFRILKRIRDAQIQMHIILTEAEEMDRMLTKENDLNKLLIKFTRHVIEGELPKLDSKQNQ